MMGMLFHESKVILDSCQKLQGLVDEVMSGEKCSAEEYINCHDDLTFFDVSNDEWEQEVFTMVQSAKENDDNDDRMIR